MAKSQSFFSFICKEIIMKEILALFLCIKDGNKKYIMILRVNLS